MKNLIKNSVFSIMLLATIFSCSSDDSPGISTPTVSYVSTTIDAIFFEAGNTTAPSITWNGDQGTLSLATSLAGLSINENTGVLSWTKALPQGTHTIEVEITNSAGQISTNLILDNSLQGVFLYYFENTCSYELIFKKDGTLNVRYIGTEDITANGTWEINANEVVSNYTFLDGSQVSIKGVLTHNLLEAKLNGNWYNGPGTVTGQEGGSIRLRLDQLPTGDGIIVLLDDGRYRIEFYGNCSAVCCYNTVAEAQNAFPNLILTHF